MLLGYLYSGRLIICTQFSCLTAGTHFKIQRLFLIPNSFYLSKLLFSPSASSPARILLGKEVHTASGYLQCTRPYEHRKWEHGLLKFTVYDTDTSILPSFGGYCLAPASISLTQPIADTSGISNNSKESLTRASSGSVRSSVSQFVPPFAPMDVDQPTSHTPFERNTTQHSLPSLRHRSSVQSLTSCCSVAQGKAEIKALLTDFQDGLNRVLDNDLQQPLHISRQASVETFNTSETLKADGNVLPTQPPSWCSHCTRDINASQNGGYLWYSCVDCRVVVVSSIFYHQDVSVLIANKPKCKNCHEKGKPGFCFNAMGPHSMHLMTDINPEFSSSPAPVPWASFCSSNAPFTSTPVAIPPVAMPLVPDFCYPEYSASTSGTTEAQPVKKPVVHTGVICNMCYRTITGVRHKCLDCKGHLLIFFLLPHDKLTTISDHDLCSLCIGAGYAETHNPFHEFLEIHEPGRVIVHTVSSGNDERAAFNRPRHESQSGPPPRHTACCNLCDSKIFGDRYVSFSRSKLDFCFSTNDRNAWFARTMILVQVASGVC
jgi:next-to-BRCA1 protein 1